MASDKIIWYDDEFIAKLDQLKEMIERKNRPELHRFLIDNFGFIFTTFQYYAFHIAAGDAKDFEEADEDIRRELMRPLSWRQYRLVEGSFSPWLEEEDDVIASIWDFLYDSGKIYEKKVMSSAEVCACSIVLEQVYCCLARKRGGYRRSDVR